MLFLLSCLELDNDLVNVYWIGYYLKLWLYLLQTLSANVPSCYPFLFVIPSNPCLPPVFLAFPAIAPPTPTRIGKLVVELIFRPTRCVPQLDIVAAGAHPKVVILFHFPERTVEVVIVIFTLSLLLHGRSSRIITLFLLVFVVRLVRQVEEAFCIKQIVLFLIFFIAAKD